MKGNGSLFIYFIYLFVYLFFFIYPLILTKKLLFYKK